MSNVSKMLKRLTFQNGCGIITISVQMTAHRFCPCEVKYNVKCPNCGEKSEKKDKVCRNCGTLLKKERSFLKQSPKLKQDAAQVPLLETSSAPSVSNGSKLKLIKLIAAGAVLIFVILLAVTLVLHITSGKGKKTAESFSEYLGTNVGTAEDKLDIHLKDDSSFAIINRSDTFDYIYESEDSVSIDDIKFPEWTVSVLKTSSEKIDEVVYTDYTVLKKDSRGKKLDKRPDLDAYGRNTKINTVLDAIDCEPFRISYAIDFTRYEYRYCYELDNGDIQSVALVISADLEGRYFYSTSEELDPFFITSKNPSARSSK